MSPRVNGDLLEPTLAGSHQFRPIYSLRTAFLTCFVGGAMAGAILTAVNAHRLGRLSRDAWLIALGVSLPIGVLWWMIELGGQEWLRSALGRSGTRIVNNLVGFAYFGIAYLVHRPFYRNMEFAGITPPNGWRIGLISVLLAAVITIPLLILFMA